jgi:putative AdoMet-dependent methyltransferase
MERRFPALEFDSWAENYDRSVSNNSAFPFLGYADLLAKMVALAIPREGMKVLDLGAGTGNLSLLFAKEGCEMWCADFSTAMLEKAKQKLPGAKFVTYDMHDPLPLQLNGSFDCIVSAFTFHHFEICEKVEIIKRFLPSLSMGASIIIGDISFQNETAREQIKADLRDDWEEEFYWLAADDIPALESVGIAVEYLQMTPFSGIFHLKSLAIS